MAIFLDDHDYQHFLFVLGDQVEDSAIECWNYCLMPNHYHLTLRPTKANLSEAVRRINSAYALWWNRRHQRVGHVFQGRFKCQIVQEQDYLLRLSRYIVMNPVRAGLTAAPDGWRWSSYRPTVGLYPAPSFLTVQTTLEQFGPGDEETLRARFRHFVTADPVHGWDTDPFRSTAPVLGDRTFVTSLRAAPR